MTGADLKACRMRLGLTQVLFAMKLGVSDRTVRGAELRPEAPLTKNLEARLTKFNEAAVGSNEPTPHAEPTTTTASTASSSSSAPTNPEPASVPPVPPKEPEPFRMPFAFF